MVQHLRALDGWLPPASPKNLTGRGRGRVRTMIRWAGDDPDRDGMRETPSRVARAFENSSRAKRRTRPRS